MWTICVWWTNSRNVFIFGRHLHVKKGGKGFKIDVGFSGNEIAFIRKRREYVSMYVRYVPDRDQIDQQNTHHKERRAILFEWEDST